jgi:hypothetical protein
MRVLFPCLPADLEIPDDWLAEAGMANFARTSISYLSAAAAVLVPLRSIEPPFRNPAVTKDWRGFERARLVSVMRGIVAGAQIDPVPLLRLPNEISGHRSPFEYRVLDGYHRFYASIVAGFESLPGTMV